MSDPGDPSGYSSSDLITMGFIATPKLPTLVDNTRKVSEIDVSQFDAIVVAGGQAPMFTFEGGIDLHKKFVAFYEAGKLACALCHGVAILRYARLSTGVHLAKGKTVTGFAYVEEDFADQAVWTMNLLPRDKHVMPWRIEDEMKRIGARRDAGALRSRRRRIASRSHYSQRLPLPLGHAKYELVGGGVRP